MAIGKDVHDPEAYSRLGGNPAAISTASFQSTGLITDRVASTQLGQVPMKPASHGG